MRISIFINLANNILLLASKKYILTSQGLVGAGMNRRALSWIFIVLALDFELGNLKIDQ